MVVIDFSGSFSKETSEFDALKDAVDSSIGNIEEALTGLSECWQDDKSGTWLSTQTSNMADLKTSNNNVKTEADNYFAAIVKELNIYSE